MTPAPDASLQSIVGAEAERTECARIPVRLAARPAHRNDEPSRAGGLPERPMLRTGRRIEDGRAHARSRISVALACRLPSSPPVPCASARSQFFTCTCGMRLAAQLPHRFDDLGHAAAVGRMVVAQAAAVGVERQPADAGDQVAVGDEAAALALPAESQVLELHQDGDREAVVDRGILDVRRRDAGCFECRRARPRRARDRSGRRGRPSGASTPRRRR